MTGGLYEALVELKLMVPHEEVRPGVIRPEMVPIITYPYEWSFSQLKDAALTTLRIQKVALAHGMILRDATAYNIQFMEGRPVLIDTLSFDTYAPGEPWVAYRQFCQHFLAPLALMSRVSPDLLQLLRVHLDGIPLPLAARLLPSRAKFNLGLATHVSLHARYQKQHESTGKKAAASMPKTSLLGLVDNLERTVQGLRLPKSHTEWGDYYDNTNYSDDSMAEKSRIIEEFMGEVKPERVVDLGANDGPFSRVAAKSGALVISADIDPMAVEANYRRVKAKGELNVIPLLVDLMNPSADAGWDNSERMSFSRRARADAAMALALIHHLAISGNVPLKMVAEYFSSLAPYLVIEFVPKSDSKVQRLLATREDIFPDYTEQGFEKAFGGFYSVVRKRKVKGSARTLYLLQVKG